MSDWLRFTAIILLGSVMVGCEPRQSPTAKIASERYQQILDEITSVEFAIGSLTPDPAATVLAYVHATETGRGLSFLDLQTRERFSLRLTNEVTQVCGWSPDGRYLAFVQTLAQSVQPSNRFGLRESWLTLFDRQSHTVQRLTQAAGVFEPFFYWLGADKYALVSRWLTNDYAEIFMGRLGNDERKKISNYRPEIVVMSESRLGHLEKGNIVSLEVKPLKETDTGANHSSRTIEVLSDFKDGQFDQVKWLRYSRESGEFLFCARPATASWRHLYAFNPASKQLRQLSQEDTYNGQWLQGGAGYAYVVNTNNGFYLAVRPSEESLRTNLFVSGGVANYTVAADGTRIYITAAAGTEPHGIWEYNVLTRELHALSGGTGKPRAASQWLRPREFKIKSFDGLEIPCFLIPPAELEAADPGAGDSPTGTKSAARFPAVIYVPPPSSQFQKSFDERSQLLANVGFYFLAVNYRGCDGYGREFSALANTPNAARDILAARAELLKDASVDPNRVFLCTISGGSDVVFELLATAPSHWRGVALDKPSTAPLDWRLSPKQLPPLLVITGDADPAFGGITRFESWARSRGVKLQFVVHTNSGHFTFKVSERKDKLDQVAKFFLRSAE